MQKGKVVVGGVSIILVVGVAIGLIATVTRDGSGSNGKQISTNSKSVAAICSPTDYKQQCVESLDSVANNNSATPKDFIQAAINYTIVQVQLAMKNSGGLGKNAQGSAQKMAVDDCQDLLQFAIDELQASFSMVGDSQLHSVAQREAELKDWLSAVISYQQSCLDGVTQPDIKKELSNGLLNATQLTSNALAIISGISDILKSFNIPTTNMTTSSRRLLETQDPNGEYPSWLPVADRKLLQSQKSPAPNAIVAQDGSGQFKTIGEALAAYPKNFQGRYVIYVKAGVYNEYVIVDKKQLNVFMYGDGPEKTIVSGDKSFNGGVSTFKTAPFAAIGVGFIAKDMGFRNTAGPEGHQAVALRVQSDRSAFYNCRMEGYQDTLYTQAHRQFYRNCVISGTIDFIFGDATVIIQNSDLVVRKPMDNQQNIITAHGRFEARETTGLVIQNCRIIADPQLFPDRLRVRSYLGRPWKACSRTVYMESNLGDFIQPEGWLPWTGTLYLDTLFYAEYANRGPAAVTDKRVNWKGYKVITNKNEAEQFTAGPFIQGNEWLQSTGAPFFLGFTNNQDML